MKDKSRHTPIKETLHQVLGKMKMYKIPASPNWYYEFWIGKCKLFPKGKRERKSTDETKYTIDKEIDYNYESVVQGFQFVDNWYTEIYPLGRLHAGVQYMFRCKLIMKMDVSYAAGSYIDRDGNQFPHYRPWVVWNTVGIRF